MYYSYAYQSYMWLGHRAEKHAARPEGEGASDNGVVLETGHARYSSEYCSHHQLRPRPPRPSLVITVTVLLIVIVAIFVVVVVVPVQRVKTVHGQVTQ